MFVNRLYICKWFSTTPPRPTLHWAMADHFPSITCKLVASIGMFCRVMIWQQYTALWHLSYHLVYLELCWVISWHILKNYTTSHTYAYIRLYLIGKGIPTTTQYNDLLLWYYKFRAALVCLQLALLYELVCLEVYSIYACVSIPNGMMWLSKIMAYNYR